MDAISKRQLNSLLRNKILTAQKLSCPEEQRRRTSNFRRFKSRLNVFTWKNVLGPGLASKVRFIFLVHMVRNIIKMFSYYYFISPFLSFFTFSPALFVSIPHKNTSAKWLTPSFFNIHSLRHPCRAKMLCMLSKMIHKYTTIMHIKNYWKKLGAKIEQ